MSLIESCIAACRARSMMFESFVYGSLASLVRTFDLILLYTERPYNRTRTDDSELTESSESVSDTPPDKKLAVPGAYKVPLPVSYVSALSSGGGCFSAPFLP